ncbi:hypothetical protein AC578_6823 [Pseudocercospora eumusae]|uniref:Uncharacterized protein n=1 Tax=Pseudocercospora eumusae TaxID=321146 RepID=A0A139H4I8_9PEZI|nr:hypothetical protein AC578_6823 [Pseudocercospora eumusae]
MMKPADRVNHLFQRLGQPLPTYETREHRMYTVSVHLPAGVQQMFAQPERAVFKRLMDKACGGKKAASALQSKQLAVEKVCEVLEMLPEVSQHHQRGAAAAAKKKKKMRNRKASKANKGKEGGREVVEVEVSEGTTNASAATKKRKRDDGARELVDARDTKRKRKNDARDARDGGAKKRKRDMDDDEDDDDDEGLFVSDDSPSSDSDGDSDGDGDGGGDSDSDGDGDHDLVLFHEQP